MFFIVALTVFLLMHGYVGWRIIPSLNLSPISNYIAYVITFILGFLPLLPIILRINGYESKIIDKISLVGYTSLGFFTLSFTFLLAKDFLFQFFYFINSLFNDQQIVDESKRNFIKKSYLITLGALNYNFAPIINNINGVDISVITYSFNTGSEESNIILQNCLDSGLDNIELMGNHIEKTLGIPRSTRQHANWRSNVTNRQLKNMRKFFNDNGVNIFAFKPNCIILWCFKY